MEAYTEEKSNCPLTYVLSIMGGKWKAIILWHLTNHGVLRYGDLKRSVGGITHKMLSQQLKELVEYDLIHRKEYHQIPPKVEYSLSEKGQTLIPILNAMSEWGKHNINN
ncbi:MAG: transcriptional regulator [Firmicutes bacterium]|nr:transcriptional regulator [Bacillota bacterium]